MEEHAAQAVGPGIMELIQLANLIVVILIIYLGARKGVSSAVRARSEGFARKLSESKAELERVKTEMAAAKHDFEKIEELKKQIFSQVRVEGERLAANVLIDAKNIADRIISDARNAAEDETRVAVRRLREKVVEQALQLSVEMLNEASKGASAGKAHEKMVARFVSELKPAGEMGGQTKKNGAHV